MNIKKNSWGFYQIDFYNLSSNEKIKISDRIGMSRFDYLGCYFKSGDEWISRSSGMSFNICHLDYYSKLKIYLDKLLNIYLRKQKLLKISDIEKIKSCNV